MKIEVLNKKMIAYQSTITSYVHLKSLMQAYNSNPSIEKKNEVFNNDEQKIGWDAQNKLEEYYLFFTDEKVVILLQKLAGIVEQVFKLMDKGEKISDEIFRLFTKLLIDTKKYMMLELQNDKNEEEIL